MSTSSRRCTPSAGLRRDSGTRGATPNRPCAPHRPEPALLEYLHVLKRGRAKRWIASASWSSRPIAPGVRDVLFTGRCTRRPSNARNKKAITTTPSSRRPADRTDRSSSGSPRSWPARPDGPDQEPADSVSGCSGRHARGAPGDGAERCRQETTDGIAEPKEHACLSAGWWSPWCAHGAGRRRPGRRSGRQAHQAKDRHRLNRALLPAMPTVTPALSRLATTRAPGARGRAGRLSAS